jgi:hypothetical protein
MPRFVAGSCAWAGADEAEARRLAAAPPTTPPAYVSRWAARP